MKTLNRDETQHGKEYVLKSEAAALEAENERLRAIETAAKNLIKCKGRYHTEQAFTALVAAMKEQTP